MIFGDSLKFIHVDFFLRYLNARKLEVSENFPKIFFIFFFFKEVSRNASKSLSKNPLKIMQTQRKIFTNTRLPPEVNKVLYVRNLPFKITAEEMYDIFGKYGPIRQIRIGTSPETRGTAFVVYEDIYDAKNAVDHLNGFNVCNRYLIVLYYQQNKMNAKAEVQKKKQEINNLKEKHGVE